MPVIELKTFVQDAWGDMREIGPEQLPQHTALGWQVLGIIEREIVLPSQSDGIWNLATNSYGKTPEQRITTTFYLIAMKRESVEAVLTSKIDGLQATNKNLAHDIDQARRDAESAKRVAEKAEKRVATLEADLKDSRIMGADSNRARDCALADLKKLQTAIGQLRYDEILGLSKPAANGPTMTRIEAVAQSLVHDDQ